MIASNEYYVLHRKNRKNKSEVETSQEMVNAFDKISVSVRRAHNVNRCQQDHLYNKVSTLESEHRKSMGLLAHEQKQFIRARKSSLIPLKSEYNGFSVATKKDGIKTSFRLPSLVNEYQMQDEDYSSVESFKRNAMNRKGFVGSKHRNLRQKQNINKHIHLPSIHETQLSKAGQLKEKDVIETRRGPVDKRTSRNHRRDTIDKQQYVASWDLSHASENLKTSKTADKSYNNLDKTPLTLNAQLGLNASASTKPKMHAYSNKTIAENPNLDSNIAFSLRSKPDNTNNEYPSLSTKKFHLDRSSTNTTSELESILDKTTEIRVKQFLKLPTIGGIHESPSLEQPHSNTNSDVKNLKSESLSNRRSSVDISLDTPKRRPKSSLWKNLVHCRYLRLGEQHIHEHGITNKKCECNWCAMVRKSVAR